MDFNNVAIEYREMHNKNLEITGLDTDYFALMKSKIIKENIKNNSNVKLLDFGCGDGLLDEYLINHIPKIFIDGIDIANKSIHIANKKSIPQCAFRVYDGMNIPYENETFDYVVISQVLHHIKPCKHGKILAEISRVLKKNGKIFIFEHNPINPFTRYIVNTCPFDKDAELLNAKDLKKIISTSVLKVSKLEYISYFPNVALFKHFIKYEKYLKNLCLGAQYFLCAEKGM